MEANPLTNIRSSPWPPMPPPAVIPSYTRRTGEVLLPLLGGCLYSYLYLWTKADGAYWIYPTGYIPKVRLSGYQWDRFFWKLACWDYEALDSFY